MKAAIWVKAAPEFLAWLESREHRLEQMCDDDMPMFERLKEVRHLKNELIKINRDSQESSVICLF